MSNLSDVRVRTAAMFVTVNIQKTCFMHNLHVSISIQYLTSLFLMLYPLSLMESYRVCWNRVTGFKGYSTHLNAQKSAGQHVFRNQCLLRYGWVLHLTGYQDNTAVYIIRRAKHVMYVCLPFPCTCICCEWLNSCITYVLLRQKQWYWYSFDLKSV